MSSQFDANDKSVEALSSRNAVLNKQIDAQKEKINVLRAALDNAASSFGENDRRTQNWQIQLNNAQAALISMEKELKQNNSVLENTADEFEDAKKEAGRFGDEIKESGKQAVDASGKFKKAGTVLKTVGAAMATATATIGTAAVAAGKKLWDLADDTAQAGDEIDKNSQKIGISAEAYQEWGYVFERSGANIDGLQTGMKTLNSVIADAASGSATAAGKLAAVGLSIDDLNGKSSDEQLSIVVAALQDMESGAIRSAAASDLFGRSATDMAAVLNLTAVETQSLKNEANEYGMVMSNEAVAASVGFQDSLTKLNGTVSGLKNRMLGDLLPGFTLVTDGFSDLAIGSEAGSAKIKQGITKTIESINSLLPMVLSILMTFSSALLENAPSIIESLAFGVISLLPDAINLCLSQILPDLVVIGTGIIFELISSLSDALPSIMESLSQGLVIIAGSLFSQENISKTIQILLSFISNPISGLSTSLPILIQGVSSLVSGVITYLPECFKLISAELPRLIAQLGSLISQNLPVFIDSAISIIEGLTRSLPEVILILTSELPSIISKISSVICQNLPILINGAIQLTLGIVKNLPVILFELLKAAPSIISQLALALLQSIGMILDVGVRIVEGLWQGICNAAAWLWQQIQGWLSGLWNGILGFFGIASPSKQMAWVGKMLVKGLSDSIEDTGDEAIKATENLAKDIAAVSFAPGMLDMSEFKNQLDEALPTIEAKSAIDAAISDSSPFIEYATNGSYPGAAAPVNVSINFGDVRISSDRDIESIADQISAIIADNIISTGRSYG